MSNLTSLAEKLASALGIPCPLVTAAVGLSTPAQASIDHEPRGEIQLDDRFLQLFAEDGEACWITIAHEVGHIYWDRRDDLAGAEDGPEWEDSADFTAGQLAAHFRQDPRRLQPALVRVLEAYDAVRASRFHRSADDRSRVFVNGYATWWAERGVFR